MASIEELLDEIFAGQERVSRDEIQRRAVAADLAASDLAALDALPEGEYAHDEVADAIGTSSSSGPDDGPDEGVAAVELDDGTLLRELASLHRTRHETFLHASSQALQRHSERTTELEGEYLRRHPERDIDPDRLRSGAREGR
jgi:Family of unknown function (DUF6158)